ncbi:MAG: hypothetical protein JXA28_07320, partial [Bacteroidetes bacterium]|nr:hypothetical protein [Bacteroidota bacterium]
RKHPLSAENTRSVQKTPAQCRKHPLSAESTRSVQKVPAGRMTGYRIPFPGLIAESLLDGKPIHV